MNISEEKVISSELYLHFSEQKDFKFWTKESINNFLVSKNNSLWVQRNHNEITGIALWSFNPDQIELIYIFTHKNHRRQHIALDLFLNSLSEITKLSVSPQPLKVFLEVSELNHKAIKFYEKIGFKVSRIRKNYYSDRSNAYEMHLDLSKLF